MPRQARLDMPGALHHIMVRGLNKTEIFKDDQDRSKFLERLGQNILKGKCSVYAWVLMDNHIHILFKSGEKGISEVMRRVLTWYAIYYNHRYKRSGHLFENRYKSILCDEDSYLQELIRYIHLDPVRAGIVKGINELDKYKWSGHTAISGNIKYKWMYTEYVLAQFGRRKRKAKEAYRIFMIDGLDMGQRPELTGGGLIRSVGGWSEVMSMMRKNKKTEYDERILGSGDFVSNILKELESKEIRQLKAKKSGNGIEDIIEAECEKEGISMMELKNGSRRLRVSQLRSKIAYKAKIDLGLTNAEIARHLGVNTSAISKTIIKMEKENNIVSITRNQRPCFYNKRTPP